MWRREGRPFEGAFFAFPDFFRVVHAAGLGAQCEAFLGVFADRPGAFAKAPVVVGFAGAAVHHPLLACGAALDGLAADGLHARAREDTDRGRTAAVCRGD